MKYAKKIMLFAIILIALGISKVYAVTGTVTTDGVRVRKEPNTNSGIVTILNKSASLEIIEEVDGWYKIKYTDYGNYEGYMKKDFVKKIGEETIPTTSTTPTTPTTPEVPTTPDTVQTPEVIETPTTEEPKVDLLGEKSVSAQANVYILPVITSSIKDTINANTAVTVLEVAGNFVYVKYNNNYGWIKSNLIKNETQTSENVDSNTYTEKVGYVNVNQAIVRSKATTSSEMVTALYFNNEVTIIGEEENFYKIRLNNQECYIAKHLISDTKQQTTSRSSNPRQETEEVQNPNTQKSETNISNAVVEQKTPEPEKVETTVSKSSVGDQIAEMAKSYIGYRYVYGGASPSTGFDCSGLVYYICGQLGYSVYRTADNQVNNGVAVDKANLQPGDLVFFSNYKTYTGIGHVGIYIGNNQFVHASTATTGVIVSSLNEASYIKRYVTARRIGV